KETYDEKRNPQHFDKEYLRLWFAKQGYTGEGTPPLIPPEFAAEVAGRYITAYEKLTGQEFIPGELPAKARIIKRMEHV
ncbi:MAG: phosphoribosylaminoimidazolesuccinocarboxamide synthase, partial [Phototrophicales bacterium]